MASSSFPLPPKPVLEDKVEGAECDDCVNIEFCTLHWVVFAGRCESGILSYMKSSPCEDIVKLYHGSLAFIGVCRWDCAVEYASCPYCPDENRGECERHEVRYYSNAYFKGNGVCCDCMEELEEETAFVAIRR